VASSAEVEVVRKRSRFIGIAAPAESGDEAEAFLNGVRRRFPDATHHCYAYRVQRAAIVRLSDDGEPQGTAGRPILEVLERNGLENTCVAVVRYFGGTLLGTGGLVRAYSDAAKEVLAALPREEKVERRTLAVTVSYAAYEAARRLVAAHMGSIGDEEFAAEVTLLVTLPLPQVEPLTAALREVTAGQARVEDLG